jgi:tetratricopeptide (TPR) repeat protein
LGEGISSLQEALGALESMHVGFLRAVLLTYLGELHLLAGQIEEASECGRQANDIASEHGQPGHRARALYLLAEIAARRNCLDAAKAHYNEAASLADELGSRPLVGHCHLGLGKLYRRAGEGAKADDHFATATAMYREMGMQFWFERAEAEHQASG